MAVHEVRHGPGLEETEGRGTGLPPFPVGGTAPHVRTGSPTQQALTLGPQGVEWSRLSEDDREAMPLLAELLAWQSEQTS